MTARSLLGPFFSILLLLRSGVAMADYVVEVGPFAEFSQAEAALAMPDLGGSVITRRFVTGEGWRYIVVRDGVADSEAAFALVKSVVEAGRAASVVERNGRERRVVAAVAGAVASPPTEAPAVRPLPTADSVLALAARAHGGRSAARSWLANSKSVDLSFRRTVASGASEVVADNHYLRSGSAVRLEVSVLGGVGRDSLTVIDPSGRAWVEVGGERTVRDAARTREVVDMFSPESILAVPLAVGRDLERWTGWGELVTEARGEGSAHGADGDEAPGVVVLGRSAADASLDDGPTEVAFGGDGLLQWVAWDTDDGRLTWRFGDYRSVTESVVLPRDVVVERDGRRVEHIVITDLRVAFEADPHLFGAEAAPTTPAAG